MMKTTCTRVVLIRPEYSTAVYQATYKGKFKPGMKQVEPPMALMQLAASILDSGNDVRIIDGEAENLNIDEVVDRACEERPDIVGVTGTTPEYWSTRMILERIKQRMPHVITVVGGAHATHVPWELAEEISGIDYVVVYEGEKCLAALADGRNDLIDEYSDNAQKLLEKVGLENREKFIGKVLLGPNQTVHDLERLRPVRDTPYINMEFYRYADPELGLVATESIETARGCPYGCTFCSSASSGLGVRSVENVLDELTEINDRFQKAGTPGFVIFLDDTLTFSRQRAIELFSGIVDRGLKLHYKAFTRANTISTRHGRANDIEFARLMKKAGSVTVSFGIESGSEKLNADMHKGVTLDDYRQAYEILGKVDFEERRGSFIIGHPYETTETIKESMDFAKEVGLHRIGVNIMTPYPGTDVFDSARNGKGLYFEKGARDYGKYRRWGNSVISTEELSADSLVYWHDRFLSEIYASSKVVKHSIREFYRGNRSKFYHRPVIQAIKRKVKLTLQRKWNSPPPFETTDHSTYDPNEWGEPHIRKRDCQAILRQIYQVGPSRKIIQLKSQ